MRRWRQWDLMRRETPSDEKWTERCFRFLSVIQKSRIRKKEEVGGAEMLGNG